MSRLILKNLSKRRFCEVKEKLDLPKYSFVTDFNFKLSVEKFPIFRVTDNTGTVLNSSLDVLEKDTAIKMLDTMVKINTIDPRFNMAQREGKISFYMTCIGEEAAVVGSIAGLEDQDSIYPQYREAAALLYRGFTINQMTNQLVGNYLDNGKGRQMPVHYGSKKLNYQTVSSPLATQIPQAAGAGYYFRAKKENKVCITYFGEGAASEGDFHAGMNFAATLRSQTIFFCRNNGYAISTSFQDQYRGDGIMIRGIGYGIKSIRVDGNDAVAVYAAVKEARKISVEQGVPVLIEAMTFRRGDHSTSDASKSYRDEEVMKGWGGFLETLGDPIKRFENYLIQKGWIDNKVVEDLVKKYKIEARESLKYSLNQEKPSIESMFDDVFKDRTKIISEQYDNLKDHLKKYGENYDTNTYHK